MVLLHAKAYDSMHTIEKRQISIKNEKLLMNVIINVGPLFGYVKFFDIIHLVFVCLYE